MFVANNYVPEFELRRSKLLIEKNDAVESKLRRSDLIITKD